MFASNSDDRRRNAATGGDRRHPLGGPSLIDPIYVIGKLWKAKWFILFCAIVGAGLAAGLAMVTPKTYTATAQVLVDPRDIKVVQNEVTPNGLPSDATLALIESQMAVIDSNEVLLQVIREADLLNDTDFNGKGFSITGAIRDYLGLSEREVSSPEGAPLSRAELVTLDNLRENLNVYREPKSFVILLSVESTSPAKSARLANLLAETFIDELGEVQASTARRASDALSGRLEELRASVSDAEQAVERYKSDNRLVGVGGRLIDDDYILRINDQLARSRGDVTALRNRAEQMQSASVEDVVEGSFPEELTSEALNRLRGNYSELTQQRAVLSSSLGPRHPSRIANEEAIQSARSAIRAEVSRIVEATKAELARAENTDRDLTAQIDRLKTQQLETSGSFVRLRELEREVEAARAVYEAFLLRARETSEQESLNTANVRIISAATAPLDPSSLPRRSMVVIGFVLGLIAGFALALVWALWRPVREVFSENEASYAAKDGDPEPSGDGAIVPSEAELAYLSQLRASDTSLPTRGEPASGVASEGSDPASNDDGPRRLPQAVGEDGDWRSAILPTAGAGRPARKAWQFPERADETRDPARRDAGADAARTKKLSDAVASIRKERLDRAGPNGTAPRKLSAAGDHMDDEIETIKARLMGLRASAGSDRSAATRQTSPEPKNV